LGSGLFLAGVSWLLSLKFGSRAAANPWGANTLEWQTPSPPPHDNFSHTPVAGDPYDLQGYKYDPQTNGWERTGAPRPAGAGGH
jgi:cytochrome c oxidase subunit 1